MTAGRYSGDSTSVTAVRGAMFFHSVARSSLGKDEYRVCAHPKARFVLSILEIMLRFVNYRRS